MPPGPSRAVSFDCARAAKTVEFLICREPELSILDDRMGVAYSAARRQSVNLAQLISDQRTWLARRNSCRGVNCIANEYQARLSELSGNPSAPRGIEVQLVSRNGVLRVPASINGAITLEFIVDSGASDVVVPADVVLTLMRTGTITDDDFLGRQTYVLADGRSVPSETFRIRSLRVGDQVLENVTASVADARGSLLLGQSFLSRFQSWSVDNKRRVLVLQ